MGFSPSSVDKQQEAKRAQFRPGEACGIHQTDRHRVYPGLKAVSNVYRVEHGQRWRPLARYADLLGAT